MTVTTDANTKPLETSSGDSGLMENTAAETAKSNDASEDIEHSRRPEEWMIRGSETYKDEYSECSGLKGRFHQYFIFGRMLDCSRWKADIKLCKEWEATRSEEAYAKLIESEKIRRRERLMGHIQNDTWERRESPPEEWKKELPEALQAKYESSYLTLKANEKKLAPLGKENQCIIS